MDKQIQQLIKKYTKLVVFFEEHKTKFNDYPALKSTIQKFKTNYNKIKKTLPQLINNNTGIALEKNAVKMELSEKLAVLCGIMQAYSSINEKIGLAKKFKYHTYKLYELRDLMFQATCTELIKEIETFLPDLKDFNVEKKDIDNINLLIKKFIAAKKDVRTNIIDEKYIYQDFKDKLKEQAGYFAIIKELMVLFRNSDDDFYNFFIIVCHGRKPKYRKVNLRGYVFAKDDNKPVYKAEVSLVRKGKTVIRKTRKTGFFQFKDLPSNYYVIKVKVKSKRYQDYEEKIAIYHEKLSKMTIYLESVIHNNI